MHARVAAALLFLAAMPALAQGDPSRAALTPEQREAVVGILREALRADPSILGEALRANPQVLRDGIEALRGQEEREREAAARLAIAQHADPLFRAPGDPIRGNPRGPITLVEFFDVRCPYCKQLHLAMVDLVRRHGDVRVVLKDLPVLGPSSLAASRALLAAQRQGKYEALHDALLRLREEPTETTLRREAEKVGLDWGRLRREMEDPAIQRRLDDNLRLAQAIRVEGTPAVIVGDTLLPGAVDVATLERLVAEERERARRGG
jgi:protein-disulfide isomerase